MFYSSIGISSHLIIINQLPIMIPIPRNFMKRFVCVNDVTFVKGVSYEFEKD